VTNLLDAGPGSLRDAISGTAPGGTVDFQPGLAGTIHLTSGALTVGKDLTVAGPGASAIAVSGGGVSQDFVVPYGTTATISGLTIRDGRGDHGGGIENLGTLSLAACVFSNNTTFGVGGGGGALFNSGTMTVSASTVTANSSGGNGGAVFNVGALTLSDDTLAWNVATTGGAVANSGPLTLINATVAGNSVTQGGFGGGMYLSGSHPVALRNAIVAENVGSSGPDIYGAVGTADHNLVGNGSGSSGIVDGVDGNLVGTPAAPLSPHLGLLQDNGGPTATLALLPGSPAIDSGTNAGIPATDQRGFNRAVGGTADIGAYEFQPPTTVTTLTTNPNPSKVNQPVTLTATVAGAAPGSNIPSGTVAFYDGATLLAVLPLTNGQAAYVTAALTSGIHTLAASYAGFSQGDYQFAPSASAPVSQSVLKTETLTALSNSPSPSNALHPVTFSTLVTPSWAGAVVPTGTVTFRDGGIELATVPLAADGTAAFTTSTLAAGTHTVTAEYSGDGNFLASDSAPQVQVVTPLLPVIALTSSPNPAKVGQAVGLDGAVQGPAGVSTGPTGSVSFLDGDTVLATVDMVGDAASDATAALSAGKHALTARYNGDSYYAATTSAPVNQVVRAITLFAVGGAPGHVRVYRPDNTLLIDFVPYGSAYTGGINVAVGDVNGDGYYDLVTGASVGNPHVKVYDGRTLNAGTFNPDNPVGALLASFFPYALQFNVGANVAVGDVNGDGFADIVTGADVGNPHVKLYDGKAIALGTFQPDGASLLAQWFPYELQFNVGVTVAVGDVNADGFAEVVTGANVGNPHVKVYNGRDLAQGASDPDATCLMAQWFAYGLNFNVGANVAVGDVNGSGYASVITGATAGNPDVHVYDGHAIATNTFLVDDPGEDQLGQFFAYDLNYNIGVTVGAADFDGDGKAEVLTGASAGSPHYRVVKADAGGVKPPALFEGLPPDLQGGIAVGA
jgi:hypothetical protein